MESAIRLMRNGHPHVFNYPLPFFKDCLEELGASELSDVKMMSIAVRGAKSKDFEAFLKTIEPTPVQEEVKEETPEDIHLRNMATLRLG